MINKRGEFGLVSIAVLIALVILILFFLTIGAPNPLQIEKETIKSIYDTDVNIIGLNYVRHDIDNIIAYSLSPSEEKLEELKNTAQTFFSQFSNTGWSIVFLENKKRIGAIEYTPIFERGGVGLIQGDGTSCVNIPLPDGSEIALWIGILNVGASQEMQQEYYREVAEC
ncbi:MAG: hypothetical protein AABW49_02990 [Nanoarchaeota archaeon]